MLGNDRHGFGYSKVGRGNVSPMTINLPKLGIKHGIALGDREIPDLEGFYKELDEILNIVEKGLVSRFNYICKQNPLSGTFMYNNNTIRGYNGKDIYSAMRHGTQAIGIVGVAEMCQALFGKNHTHVGVYDFVVELLEYLKKFCAEASERNDLNFTLYFTPAESCASTMCRKARDEYGVIKDITDKEFFTNSTHVPVWEEVSIYDKINIEAPLCKYGTAGCITYTEFESKIMNNPKAIERVIDYAMNNNVPYFAINFPIDTCLDCGYSGDIDDECVICGSKNIEHLARVTGYLSTDVSHFNIGKQDEVKRRFKHSKKTNFKNEN